MLVDLLKLRDDEKLKVVLDGKKIYEKTLEKGALKPQIPMPYTTRGSRYNNDLLKFG